VATITRRGNSWILQWREGGRQCRKSLGRTSQREADRLRRLKEEELQRARYAGVVSLPSPASGIPALEAFIVHTYLPWRGQEHPATQYGEIGRWANHLLPRFGTLQLDRISKSALETYKATRRKDGVKAATITKELRSLQAALNRAVFLDLLPRNPARGVRPPKDLESRPPRWYSPAELGHLYTHSVHLPGDEQAKGLPPNGLPDWSPVWRLMANTGLRRTEALQLRWEHVDEAGVRILSTETARTKSGRWRLVPVSAGATSALARLRAMTGSTPYVLPQVHADALTAAFRRHLGRAGLDGSLHCLRHTFCASLVSSGVPLRTVQVLAGHAGITTTERYAHLAPDHLAAAVAGLDL
jgi:integrase